MQQPREAIESERGYTICRGEVQLLAKLNKELWLLDINYLLGEKNVSLHVEWLG